MICIPLKYRTNETLQKNLRLAVKKSDLVEIWFDELSDLKEKQLQQIFKIKTPVIYKSIGNQHKLEKILKFQPDYIDLDLKTDIKIIKAVKKLSPKTKIIISYHDYKKTPEINTLKKIAQKCKKRNADIIKIAVFARNLEDNLKLFELMQQLNKQKIGFICLAMGKKGELSRMTGHLFGNYLMYASLTEKSKTAPGQITIEKLKKIHQLIS